VQLTIGVGSAKRMKPELDPAVLDIVGDNERSVKKQLLDLEIGDAVLLVLPGIAFVPIKADVRHLNLCQRSAA
jgi:hypothetical protein